MWVIGVGAGDLLCPVISAPVASGFPLSPPATKKPSQVSPLRWYTADLVPHFAYLPVKHVSQGREKVIVTVLNSVLLWRHTHARTGSHRNTRKHIYVHTHTHTHTHTRSHICDTQKRCCDTYFYEQCYGPNRSSTLY